MKVLVTGVKGQLGFDVVKELTARGVDHKGTDIDDLDITDREAVLKYIADYKPDTVIHCSAYTAVDKAEDELELCRLVNEDGTRHIAEACKQINAKMIYISTDYVFPGTGEAFYKPYDQVKSSSVYGATKLAGERAVQTLLTRFFIVRISWVFGINGNNFIKTMLRLGRERDNINVVCDQIGSPTYTADLALLLCDMIYSEKYGIYHATNEGICSWAEFAEEVFNLSGLPVKVNPIPASSYQAKAARPYNSRLDKSCLDEAGFKRLPHWKDALNRYLQLLKENGQ